MKIPTSLSLVWLLSSGVALASAPLELTQPIVKSDAVSVERDGRVEVEAEHFYKQTNASVRAWYITTAERAPKFDADPDPSHAESASGGAYVEILPDTRTSHGDTLTGGENFTDRPGTMATLHYKVRFATPGRYYVWCRVFSTNTEDNGVHVGLNGEWPESGRRWQTTEKRRWVWDCRQRTGQNHLGNPRELFLDIPTPGVHEIAFAMREDGFELDSFLLTTDRAFTPEGAAPSTAQSATAPALR